MRVLDRPGRSPKVCVSSLSSVGAGARGACRVEQSCCLVRDKGQSAAVLMFDERCKSVCARVDVSRHRASTRRTVSRVLIICEIITILITTLYQYPIISRVHALFMLSNL